MTQCPATTYHAMVIIITDARTAAIVPPTAPPTTEEVFEELSGIAGSIVEDKNSISPFKLNSYGSTD